ncbi:MAG: transporter [Minicystis sp.]
MRSSPSRSRSAALLAAAFATLAPARAAAQACCSGATSLGPARLAPHEDGLAAVQIKIGGVYGSFDAHRRFIASPSGTVELDLEQDLIGAVRVLDHGQISLQIPLVETYRRVPGLSEAGGGLGDMVLGARWEFTYAGRSRFIPGIALSAGLLVPTGRAPESASGPLAASATGIGAFQGSTALALEHTFGPILVNLTGSVSWRSARTVGALREQQGVQLVASAAGGYTFRNSAVLALTAAYTAELSPSIDGTPVPDGGRAATRVGLAGGYPFAFAWRLQGTVYADLPVRFFGWNQPISSGMTFVLIRSFF